jgi:hypothetical protein
MSKHSSPKKRDKKYVMKAGRKALSPAFGFLPDELNRLKLSGHVALNDLVEHRGNNQGFAELIARVITGRELAIMYFTEELAELHHSALNKLLAVYRRSNATQIWDITEDERQSTNESLSYIDDMHSHISRKEYFSVREYVVAALAVTELMNSQQSWDDYKLTRLELTKIIKQ